MSIRNDGRVMVGGVSLGHVLDWVVVGLAIGVIARVSGCGSDSAATPAASHQPVTADRPAAVTPSDAGQR